MLFKIPIMLRGRRRPRLRSGADPQYHIFALNGVELKTILITQISHGDLKLDQRCLTLLNTTNEKQTMNT